MNTSLVLMHGAGTRSRERQIRNSNIEIQVYLSLRRFSICLKVVIRVCPREKSEKHFNSGAPLIKFPNLLVP